jgi:hypothetical protein
MNPSAAIVPAATALSCDAGHFGSAAGSGVGLKGESGRRVAVALDGAAVGSPVGVGTTVAGAVQHTRTAAKSKRSIARR